MNWRHFSAGGAEGEEAPPVIDPRDNAIAELRARLEESEKNTAEAMRAVLGAVQGIASPAPPRGEEELVDQGYRALITSQDPKDHYYGTTLGKIHQELQATKAELKKLRDGTSAGVPPAKVAACEKYMQSGDAGNMAAAYRLVLLDEKEAAESAVKAKEAEGAGRGNATAQGSARPANAPSPAAPPVTPPATPGAGMVGEMKKSEWAAAVNEQDERGRPTPRAIELLAAERKNKLKLIPG